MRKIDGSISYQERAEFSRMTAELDAEIDALMKPTDGWDPVPRPFCLGEPTEVRDNLRVAIPRGHIALMGDFDPQK